MSTPNYSLYLVTDQSMCEARGRSVTEVVSLAVAGGVTCIQIREKDGNAREFLHQVLDVCATVPDDVTVIVYDRIGVFLAARTLGASVDGVHIGQEDFPASVVRQLIGPAAIMGVSASTPEEITQAESDGADYIGIGVVHSTDTKLDAPSPLGVTGTSKAAHFASIPAVAIGGIKANDMSALRAGGLSGAAVVSAICLAEDPTAAAQELLQEWSRQ